MGIRQNASHASITVWSDIFHRSYPLPRPNPPLPPLEDPLTAVKFVPLPRGAPLPLPPKLPLPLGAPLPNPPRAAPLPPLAAPLPAPPTFLTFDAPANMLAGCSSILIWRPIPGGGFGFGRNLFNS